MAKRIGMEWKRAGAFVVIAACVQFLQTEPAFAFAAAATTVSSEVCQAFDAAKTVLTTAAVLALIIGLAPMLWGQVKVKWIISALVGSMLFGLTTTIISAFAGGNGGCS